MLLDFPVYRVEVTSFGVQILIDGSTSHTHAPGREMAAFLWEDAGSEAVIGKDQVLQCWYPFGTYTVSLTVTDNRMETAATSITVVVAPESKVPGTCFWWFWVL